MNDRHEKTHDRAPGDWLGRAQAAIETGQPRLAMLYMRKAEGLLQARATAMQEAAVQYAIEENQRRAGEAIEAAAAAIRGVRTAMESMTAQTQAAAAGIEGMAEAIRAQQHTPEWAKIDHRARARQGQVWRRSR